MYIVNNLAAEPREKFKNNEFKSFISNILIQLGIPANIKGYVYLREAITIRINNLPIDIPITKILYPDIAKKFNTSASCVERAIRHAIEVAWKRRETKNSYWDEILLFSFFRFDKKPTNSEFIAMAVECVLLRNQ